MGIFTRFRDIISSNINAMLDKAEDPEKLLKLMIQEMEDTLIELKASCAGVMADCKKIQRQWETSESKAKQWDERAKLAVSKDRDDLAREALIEKRVYTDKSQSLERELGEHNALVDQYHDDILQLEEKLQKAREKQRIFVQRHIHAVNKKRAQKEIRRVDASETLFKFEELENRIDRMEAEADLVNIQGKPDLEAAFNDLVVDEDIEEELKSIKSSMDKKESSSPSAQ